MQTKNYYLSSFRSVFCGLIFLIIGISLFFIGFDPDRSFTDNFQSMVLDFDNVGNFIGSFLLLLFKIGFIAVGYIFLKYRNKIIRAKLDKKGIYFKKIPERGTKFDRVAFDMNPLVFIPYSRIMDIYIKDSFWTGRYLEIETRAGREALITLSALSKEEMREIYKIVKEQIENR